MVEWKGDICYVKKGGEHGREAVLQHGNLLEADVSCRFPAPVGTGERIVEECVRVP